MGDFQKKRVPDDSQAPIVPLDSDHAYGIRRTKIEHTGVSKPQPMDWGRHSHERNHQPGALRLKSRINWVGRCKNSEFTTVLGSGNADSDTAITAP